MKKGFTLIELLAVIVILAIIALIATPIILGIINDAREESNERSVELYASAAKNAIARYQLNNTTAPTSFDQLDIEYDGDVDCAVQELYEDGSFYLEGCKVNDGDKEYSYGVKKSTEKIMYTIEDIKNQTNQDVIKYDPVSSSTCTSGDTCYSWYVLEDGDTTTLTTGRLAQTNQVTLMLNKNIIEGSSWCNLTDGSVMNGCDVYQPEAAINTLNNLTNTWTVTASLPTYEQIYAINNSNVLTDTLWLYENITDDYTIPPSDAAVYGYWTSTLAPNSNPYFIQLGSKVSIENGLYPADRTGIRPIITISKDQIK